MRRNPISAMLRDDGGLSVLMVFLIPAFILIFAAAIDISKLNAQRRYAQAQADLSALSAVRRLPDSPLSRGVAEDVLDRNPFYGQVEIRTSDVVFGTFRPGSGLVPSADQYARSGIDAVAVTARSPYRPVLLRPFLGDETLWVTRRAVAARQDLASFTLRNALLRVDTNESILSAVLQEHLHLNAALLSYEGLATSQVSIRQLAGIVSAQAGLQALTFTQVMQADVTFGQLLWGLADENLIPFAALGTAPGGTLRLAHLIQVSPQSARMHYMRSLPDLSVSMFDLLFAMANLSGKNTHHRVSVTAGLDAAPLTSPRLGLDLVDPGVTVIGPVAGADPLRAEVAQIRAIASADLAGLVGLDLDLGTAVATATLVSLNCSAVQPWDVVARFVVETHPATLEVSASLLTGTNPPSGETPVSFAGHSRTLDIRLGDIGRPVEVPNPIAISAVSAALSDTLAALRDDLGPAPGPVGSLLGGALSLVTQQINALTGLIASQPMLDMAAQRLLDMMGIDVAQAEIVFHGFDCHNALVQ